MLEAAACLLLSLQAAGPWEVLHRFDGATAGDLLGWAVSGVGDLDGDGAADLAIGAPERTSGTCRLCGAVYVYSGASGALLAQLSGSFNRGRLGASLAAAGDVDGDGTPDLIAGAPSDDLTQRGRALVYSGRTGAVLYIFSNPANQTRFGWDVAGAGDVDGDGYDDLLVSDPYADFAAADGGSLAWYSGATGALLRRLDGALSDLHLGAAVANAGDLDGDGFPDALAGAPGYTLGGFSGPLVGSVYVVSGAGGALLRQIDSPDLLDGFGSAVASPGDLDGDGKAEILAGAPHAGPGGGVDVGSAFLWSGASGALLARFDGELVADQFGSSVAGTGDLSGDDVPDFAVGARYADLGGLINAGRLYVYSGADGSLLRRIDGLAESDTLGTDLAGPGDLDGDGRPDLIAGAPYAEPNGLLQAGSAFAYRADPYLLASAATLSAAAGGSIQLDLDFPAGAAGWAYRSLISAHGVGALPYGVTIPLVLDGLLLQTAQGLYPGFSIHTGLSGRLDASGAAQAAFTVAPGAAAGLIGRTAALAVVAAPPGAALPEITSAATTFTISP